MKDFLVGVGKVALGIFIVGTLILGAGTDSMKSTTKAANTRNATNMANVSGW